MKPPFEANTLAYWSFEAVISAGSDKFAGRAAILTP
jgi:hypothetical protein